MLSSLFGDAAAHLRYAAVDVATEGSVNDHLSALQRLHFTCPVNFSVDMY